jgi:hypothetical protein
MKKIFLFVLSIFITLMLFVFLMCNVLHAGALEFDWGTIGGADSVYTLRLVKLNLATYVPVHVIDYKATGVTSIVVTDICQKFYPPPVDTSAYGIIARVGGYAKENGKWIWKGWSSPVVFDVWGDLGE